jgi:hypothetical protein
MSFSVVFQTSAGSADTNVVTTGAQNSTGADLIVILAGNYNGGLGSTVTLTDSKGNTWTPLTKRTGGAQDGQLFYCANPTVGTGHTFTLTSVGGSGFPFIGVLAVTGANAIPFDVENGSGGTGTSSRQPGSITPAQDNSLVVAGINAGAGIDPVTVDGGFAASASGYDGANHLGGGIGYLIQTTAAAANPTWSWGGGNADTAAVIGAFKPAAGGSATGYTWSGPSTGVVNNASSNFTITATGGTFNGTESFDLMLSGVTGSFSADPVTPSAGASTVTFTLTPTAAGAATLSVTNNKGWTNPANLVYSVTQTIAVTDANWFFSPYNWKKSGSAYAQSNNPGAYFKTKFTGTLCKLNVDVSPLTGASVSSANYPTILYSIDGGAFTRYQLASSDTQITLGTGLSAGTHTLELHFVGIFWNSNDRWTTPAMVLRLTGLVLAGATAAPSLYPGRAVVYGDSLGEGWEVLASGVSVVNEDSSLAFPAMVGRALETEYGVVCFAGQGYVTSVSTANVPALSSSWDLYYAGTSRLSAGLFSPAPDWIISAHGTNDLSSVAAIVTSLAAAWRTAAPSAKIAFAVPPGQARQSEIASGVTAAADANVKLVDVAEDLLTGGAYRSGTHLTQRGQARYSAAIAAKARGQFGTYAAAADVRLNVDRGDGTLGTLALPAAGDVQLAITYGGGGTEFTGTFGVPTAAQVLFGVGFGAAGTEFTGTIVLPTAGQVESGVHFGPGNATVGTFSGGGTTGTSPSTITINDPNGNPVEGAEVFIALQKGVTDANGQCVINVIDGATNYLSCAFPDNETGRIGDAFTAVAD